MIPGPRPRPRSPSSPPPPSAGDTGRPGEEITYSLGQFLTDAITDTIESLGGQVGAYDRALITHLAGYLDPVEAATVCSWIRRAAGDESR